MCMHIETHSAPYTYISPSCVRHSYGAVVGVIADERLRVQNVKWDERRKDGREEKPKSKYAKSKLHCKFIEITLFVDKYYLLAKKSSWTRPIKYSLTTIKFVVPSSLLYTYTSLKSHVSIWLARRRFQTIHLEDYYTLKRDRTRR